MSKKRVLVFTNNPISLNNSNGRSIYNLLGEFDDYEITNLFVHSGDASLPNINYFRLSDKDALKSRFTKSPITFEYTVNKKTNNSKSKGGLKKTSLKMLLRGFLWNNKRLAKIVVQFAKRIKPDILIYQVGDSYFFNNIAVMIKTELKIPMIVYDTEDYYFKDWDFIKSKFYKSPFFRIYKKKYNCSFELLLSRTDKAVFLTEDLESIHRHAFLNLSSDHIYNSHCLTMPESKTIPGLIVYSGNLEVGRLDAICSVSKVLKEINPDLKITVCSQTKQKTILSKIANYRNIVFLGEVSYEENLKLLASSQLILHVESFDPFYVSDTKHAFSTKIPDCLFTLNSILIFSPKSSTISKYFQKYSCGWVCEDLITLRNSLEDIVGHSFENKYKTFAEFVTKTNHDPVKNSQKMLKIVEELL